VINEATRLVADASSNHPPVFEQQQRIDVRGPGRAFWEPSANDQRRPGGHCIAAPLVDRRPANRSSHVGPSRPVRPDHGARRGESKWTDCCCVAAPQSAGAS